MALNNVNLSQMMAGLFGPDSNGPGGPTMDPKQLQNEIAKQAGEDSTGTADKGRDVDVDVNITVTVNRNDKNDKSDGDGGAIDNAGDGGLELTMESLAEAAGDEGVFTVNELVKLLQSLFGDDFDAQDTAAFAEALAPLIEENVDDPVISSATAALAALELESVGEDEIANDIADGLALVEEGVESEDGDMIYRGFALLENAGDGAVTDAPVAQGEAAAEEVVAESPTTASSASESSAASAGGNSANASGADEAASHAANATSGEAKSTDNNSSANDTDAVGATDGPTEVANTDAADTDAPVDGALTDLQQLVVDAGMELAQMGLDLFGAMMGDADSPYAGLSGEELLQGLEFFSMAMNFVAQAAQFAFGGESGGVGTGFPLPGDDGVVGQPPAYDPDQNGDGEISLDESVNQSVYNMGQTVVNAASPNDILNGGRPL